MEFFHELQLRCETKTPPKYQPPHLRKSKSKVDLPLAPPNSPSSPSIVDTEPRALIKKKSFSWKRNKMDVQDCPECRKTFNGDICLYCGYQAMFKDIIFVRKLEESAPVSADKGSVGLVENIRKGGASDEEGKGRNLKVGI